jgi:hypothetical protein
MDLIALTNRPTEAVCVQRIGLYLDRIGMSRRHREIIGPDWRRPKWRQASEDMRRRPIEPRALNRSRGGTYREASARRESPNGNGQGAGHPL